MYVAENDVLSTITYLFKMATTHIFIGTSSKSLHNVKPINVTKGARDLLRLVNNANTGASIHHVLQALITSTYDTTVCEFRGIEKKLEG